MDKEFEEGNFEESDEEKYVVSDDDDLPHKCGICKKQVDNCDYAAPMRHLPTTCRNYYKQAKNFHFHTFLHIFIIHTIFYYWKWMKINEKDVNERNVWNVILKFGALD